MYVIWQIYVIVSLYLRDTTGAADKRMTEQVR